MTGRVIGDSLTHARAGEFSKTSQGHVLENTFFQKRTARRKTLSLGPTFTKATGHHQNHDDAKPS
jgi:hypothetical protein